MGWTGLKEGNIYTAQITPYHGSVQAEIICKHDSFKGKEYLDDLWLCVMNKEFGRMFSSQPREKDWQRAVKWVETQLNLIEKYSTAVVKQPEPISTSLKNSKEG